MADNNNKPPSHDSGSLLRSAVAVSPFAVGIGIAAYRARQEGNTEALPSSIREATETLGQIKRKVSRPSYSAHLDFMQRGQADGWFSKVSSKAAARTAWSQALASSGAYSSRYLPKIANAIGDMPDDQVVDALMSLSKHETDITRSMFGRFRSNFEALQGIAEVPRFTSVAGLAFDRGPEITSISPPQAVIDRLNALGNWTADHYSRGDFLDEGLGMYKVELGVAGKQIKFNLPIANNGAVVEGPTQASRRIAPRVGLIDPDSKDIRYLERHEYFLEELEESIIKDVKLGRFETQSDVDRAINELYKRTYSELESIPNVPASVRGPGLQRYQDIRGKAVDLMIEDRLRRSSGREFSAVFRDTTMEETAEAIKRHGLFAGTGAVGTAGGRVQSINLAEQTLFPEAVDWSRKPEAAIRPFELTKQSADQMNSGRYAKYRDYEAMAVLQNDLRMQAPHFKAVYVDPNAMIGGTRMDQYLTLGEGEAIGRRGLSDLIEYQDVRTQHLKTVQGGTVDEFIGAVKGGKFKAGDILGWDATGDVVRMKEGSTLLDAITNRTQGKGEFITIVEANAARIQSNEKWFGDFKGLMRLSEDMWFQNKVRSITKQNQFAQDVDVIVSMDELKKDPAKFAKQILTGMSEAVRSQGAPTGTAREFALNPRSFAKTFQSQAMASGGFSPEDYARFTMKFAVGGLGLTPSEFGSTFGAVPYIFGKEKSATMLAEALNLPPGVDSMASRQAADYWASMNQGFAGGVARAVYGGSEELRGAGALGSLEPRAFEVLRSPAFAGVDNLDADFLARMHAADPQALRTHEALTKTILSMGGIEKPEAGARIFDVGKEFMAGNTRQEFQKFIEFDGGLEHPGGWIRPGKGLHDIYVPGSKDLAAMRPYTTATGKTVSGDLAQHYHRMVEESSRMYSGAMPVGSTQVREELENIMGAIHKEQAPAGKGAGAYLRGKVLGSRFLTGVSEEEGFRSNDPRVIGLPDTQARQMFKEMKKVGTYTDDAIDEMQKRFMSGEEIGGVVARHPLIGEYSMQPTLFKRVRSDAPRMVLPEFSTDITEVGSKEAPRTIKLGPLVGMAGDKDADLFSAMLVAPDAEKQIRNNLRGEDSEFLHRYTQHQVRYQMLKAKGAKDVEGLPTIARMIGGAEKLGITPEWVPALSLQMSSAKRAVRQFGQGAGAADAMMALEWLEQTPISAKHLSLQKAAEGDLRAGMTQLTSAFQNRDVNSLKEVFSDILEGNKIAASLLKGDVQIQQTDAESIRKIMGLKSFDSKIQHVDLDQALGVIMSSLDKYRSTGAETEANLLAARGRRMSEQAIPEIAAMQKAAMNVGGDTGFASVSRAAIEASNKLAAFGAGVIKHKKPIGIGFAAMLGIGAVLSTPDELVGSGQALIPDAKANMRPTKAANRMKPEDVHPGARPVGNPTPPNMMRQQSAMISPPGEARNMYVRAQSNRLNQQSMARMMRDLGGKNRQVNVNLRDDRSAVNQHSMANKLS